MLASIVPGDPGTPGVNVYGDSIEPEKKAGSSLVAGSGTVFDPATRALHSTLAGQVIIHENESTYRIDVENVLRLKDVDYSTGHIDFPWSVIIEGTILDGFQVVSGGDIVVEKTVGSVTLRAKKDIQLGEGITGRDRAFITAGGNVFAKFVQGSVINAGGGIFVEEAVMLSRLLAGGDIVLDAGRGELIGGLARAGRMVRARKIGSRLEVPTVVLVGISPEALAQLSALEEEIVSRMAVMHRVETHISQIEEAIKRGRSYEENQTETLEKLRAVRASGWAYLESLEKQRTVIAQSLSTNPESCVEALEEVFPGVEIRFGASVRKYSVGRNPIPDYSLFIRDGDSVVLRHSKF